MCNVQLLQTVASHSLMIFKHYVPMKRDNKLLNGRRNPPFRRHNEFFSQGASFMVSFTGGISRTVSLSLYNKKKKKIYIKIFVFFPPLFSPFFLNSLSKKDMTEINFFQRRNLQFVFSAAVEIGPLSIVKSGG